MQTNQPSEGNNREQLHESLASETDKRASKALPMKGSEDACSIRGFIGLPESAAGAPSTPPDYLPDEKTEWFVSVSFSTPTIVTRDQIKKHLAVVQHKELGSPTVYGRDTKTGRWTYALAGGAPEAFSELKVAWNYYASWSEETCVGAKVFERRIQAVITFAGRFGVPIVDATRKPFDAEVEAKRLKAIYDEFGIDAIIVLRAPSREPFDGRQIWDSMLSLGLRWGDMDLFHWDNTTEWGDDRFFSVWTSTAPGYFLSEQIAAGETQVCDLIFGFSIPRCYRPMEVTEAMIRSANYCQRRMGGTLLNSTGSKFSSDQLLHDVQKTASGLTQNGFEPGSSAALHLF